MKTKMWVAQCWGCMRMYARAETCDELIAIMPERAPTMPPAVMRNEEFDTDDPRFAPCECGLKAEKAAEPKQLSFFAME